MFLECKLLPLNAASIELNVAIKYLDVIMVLNTFSHAISISAINHHKYLQDKNYSNEACKCKTRNTEYHSQIVNVSRNVERTRVPGYQPYLNVESQGS